MVYDVIIVGGGPAGIAAGIYARRANKQVLILERFAPGGQLNLIGNIENYPGFGSIDGNELSEKFYQHAIQLGIEFRYESVIGYMLGEEIKKVTCQKNEYLAKVIILAQGSHNKELNIPGEQKMVGRGISYCALCDGNFFKGKDVAVVGSGDAAVTDVIYLADICRRVYLLTKDHLQLVNYQESELENRENVQLLKGAESTGIIGSEKVEGLQYVTESHADSLAVEGIFVAIGRTPDTELLKGLIELDDKGFIVTDQNMHTSIAGVYACGDVRKGSLRQIATAVGDGAIAGTEAIKYIALQSVKQTPLK